MIYRLSLVAALLLVVSSCQEKTDDPVASDLVEDEAALVAERLDISEKMIDAFYSFDPEQLSPFLSGATDTAERILFYQGWAEGGNYKVLSRAPCSAETPETVSCGITVEDDAVMALKSDFKVTDTFTISFEGTTIEKVETSSNDQPVYYQAGEWVAENLPEVMEGPCQGFFADGPTPGDCARAMADGYRQFAESDDFPG